MKKDMDQGAAADDAARSGHPGTCDCIARVNKEMASFNTKIHLPWFGPQQPFVETIKADDSKRGKPRKLFASYCPFCGRPYPLPSKDEQIT